MNHDAKRWILFALVLAAALIGLSPMHLLAEETTIAVPIYEIFEIDLTADHNYSNPYQNDVELQAIFTGPEGITKTVYGFWDGDNRFKVRFTPTVEGLWSYSVMALQEPEDAGLTLEGELLAIPPETGRHGFVRRAKNHSYSFAFDDGTRYFMMGQTYYEIVRNALAGDKWQEAVDNSKAHGINKIRMLIFPWDEPENQFYPDAEPFLNGNHDLLNLSYWQKLDEIVHYLDAQNTVADLILFADTSRAFGSLTQDQRYVRYILSRYAAYPNVIWCLTNEWELTNKNKSYWNEMGEIVADKDPWMVNQDGALRPFSIHQKTNDGTFQFFDADWPVHAIVQYGVWNDRFSRGDEWGNSSILYNLNHNMPVVNDEYGYLGQEDRTESPPYPALSRTKLRNALWSIVTGGGFASVGDARIFNDGPNGEPGVVYKTSNWHDAEEYDDIKHMMDFWTKYKIPYWQMTEQNALVTFGSRVYVLGHPQNRYVVYAAAGGEFDLALPAGTYEVLRYNPREGTREVMPAIYGGATRHLTMPDNQDWVLYLEAVPRIKDLRVIRASIGASGLWATLQWTAPQDVITYTLRYDDTYIHDADWDNATDVNIPSTVLLPGTLKLATVNVPYTDGTVYFALKYQNAEGEWSAVSFNAFWPHLDLYMPFISKNHSLSLLQLLSRHLYLYLPLPD